MQGFQAHNGLASFIKRLDMEVNICRKEQPFEIEPENISTSSEASSVNPASPNAGSNNQQVANDQSNSQQVFDEDASLNPMELSEDENMTNSSSTSSNKTEVNKTQSQTQQQNYQTIKGGKTCLPQRAALLKSMFNFLKKVIQDSNFSDSIRHIMEGTLPSSLKHIISNCEYYGASLFLLATDIVTVYVFQEPSLLSTLQDNGLTEVVLHALLDKDVSVKSYAYLWMFPYLLSISSYLYAVNTF